MPIGPVDDRALFPSLNIVLLGYLLLAFAPKWKWTSAITLVLPATYSALYASLIVNFLLTDISAMRSVDFGSLDGIVALFSRPDVVMAGWVHYVAFDLLVARYIVFDAIQEGISHIFIIPLIPVTLMLGPIGFLLYSVLKVIRAIQWSLDDVVYRVVLCLCSFMIMWIFVFPASSFLAIGSTESIAKHKSLLEEHWSSGKMITPVATITKYYKQPLIVLTHILPSSLWCMLVPIQLSSIIREKYSFLHRLSGYLLLSVVPFVSIGVYIIVERDLSFENDYPDLISQKSHFSEWGLSPFTDSFLFMKVVFYTLAAYFTISAFAAWYYAFFKNFACHRAWMLRHVASGIWVALQRVYLVVRQAQNTECQRAAFYDGAFLSASFTICLVEVYLRASSYNTTLTSARPRRNHLSFTVEGAVDEGESHRKLKTR
jgi:hypothetical protein